MSNLMPEFINKDEYCFFMVLVFQAFSKKKKKKQNNKIMFNFLLISIYQ